MLPTKIFIFSLALVTVFGFSLGIERSRAQLEVPIFVKEVQPLKAPRPLFVEGELIIKFKSGVNENAIRGLEREQNVSRRQGYILLART